MSLWNCSHNLPVLRDELMSQVSRPQVTLKRFIFKRGNTFTYMKQWPPQEVPLCSFLAPSPRVNTMWIRHHRFIASDLKTYIRVCWGELIYGTIQYVLCFFLFCFCFYFSSVLCGFWDHSFPTRFEPRPSAMSMESNHWTTREFPGFFWSVPYFRNSSVFLWVVLVCSFSFLLIFPWINIPVYVSFLLKRDTMDIWVVEGLGAGGKGDDRGWDGWMASLTRWTWVWVNSGIWWWTGRSGVLWFMGSQRVGHVWATELNWTECDYYKQCHDAFLWSIYSEVESWVGKMCCFWS